MNKPFIEGDHPFKDYPHLWCATFTPPPLADPERPHDVQRSHLKKIELGKSSSSCKVAFITRLHRSLSMQEFWCASFEEAEVYLNLAAHPFVVGIKEQLTRVPFVDASGKATLTLVDAHVLRKDGAELLVSVKYYEKAVRQAYLDEVSSIAKQCHPDVADRFLVASRFSFHPVYRDCARAIHSARRGWDPQADRIVLEAANDLGVRFSFSDLVDASRLTGRGHRAAIRLIGDGEIGKHLLDGFKPDTQLWMTAA